MQQGIGSPLDVLRANYLAIEGVKDEFSVENITNALKPVFEKYGKALTLNNCFRYPLTGKDKSPNGLDVAYILGKDETLRRIASGAKKLCDYGNWSEYFKDYWLTDFTALKRCLIK